MFEIHWDRNGVLNATGETIVWQASNKLFGSHWTLAVTIKTAAKKQARFANPSAPIIVAVTAYGIFLYCKGRSPPQASSPADAPQQVNRKFSTFLRISLPAPPPGTVESDDWGIQHARQSFQVLFNVDSKLVFYPYSRAQKKDSKPTSTLQTSAGAMTMKYSFIEYCDKVWFSSNV